MCANRVAVGRVFAGPFVCMDFFYQSNASEVFNRGHSFISFMISEKACPAVVCH